MVEGLIVRQTDWEEVGAQGDTVLKLKEGDVPVEVVGLVLAVVWVNHDPPDRMVPQFQQLAYVRVTEKHFHTLVLSEIDAVLGVDGMGSSQDPSVTQQGSAPTTIDTGEGLPREVAQLSWGRTKSLRVLDNGDDWSSTDCKKEEGRRAIKNCGILATCEVLW